MRPEEEFSCAAKASAAQQAQRARALCRRFSKRLRRAPQQCARLDPGGEPLWPDAVVPAHACCAACGAPRRFELQLMAPLVAALEEAADWAEELEQPDTRCADPGRAERGGASSSGENSTGGSACGSRGSVPECGLERAEGRDTAGGFAAQPKWLRPPDSWEWLTVAVFTCSVSCHAGGGTACFVEEEAVFVNEH